MIVTTETMAARGDGAGRDGGTYNRDDGVDGIGGLFVHEDAAYEFDSRTIFLAANEMGKTRHTIDDNLHTLVHDMRDTMIFDILVKHSRKQSAAVFLWCYVRMMAVDIGHIIAVETQYRRLIILHKAGKCLRDSGQCVISYILVARQPDQGYVIKCQAQRERIVRNHADSLGVVIRKGNPEMVTLCIMYVK